MPTSRQEMIDDLIGCLEESSYRSFINRLLEMLTHEQLVAIYREYIG